VCATLPAGLDELVRTNDGRNFERAVSPGKNAVESPRDGELLSIFPGDVPEIVPAWCGARTVMVVEPRPRSTHRARESACTWTLCSLLGAAWLSFDAALWDHLRSHHLVWPQAAAVCGLGTVFGQTVLASLGWLTFRGSLTLRLLIASAVLYLLANLAAALAGEPGHASQWLALLCGWSAMLVLTFCIVVLGGWRLGPAERSEGQRAARGQCQFSLASLFQVTTVTAFCLGALHWLNPPARPLASLALFCLLMTCLSLAALSPLTRSSWRLGGISLSLLASPVLALLLAKTGIPPAGHYSLTLMICAHTITVAGSATVLRIAGLAIARPS